MTVERHEAIRQVRHVTLATGKSARAVHERLLDTLPRLDPALAEHARAGDVAWVRHHRQYGSPLWLFEVRDHGALLAVDHETRSLWQYEIGNPLTAESMTRYRPEAALYAPLRVVLRETAAGSAFNYDLPSDLFGQLGDDRVAKTGKDLDHHLEAALTRAIGEA